MHQESFEKLEEPKRSNQTLKYTSDESSDIVITCSISNNDKFEWIDEYINGIYEPKEIL